MTLTRNESLAVAKAAGKAANDIEHVQSELRALRADAAELHMTIDAVSNKVVPGSSFNGPPMEALIAEMQLQPRLDKILAEANSVDAELAAAINMADGDAPVPAAPHDNRPEIQRALSRPLPTDPKQLHDLWDKLTPEEKDWLYSQNHNIGNDNGMPTADRDHYNRLNLADQLSSATAAAARADALKAQHPDWAQGHNIPSPNEPGRSSMIASPTKHGSANMTLRVKDPSICPIYRPSAGPSKPAPIANSCCWTPKPASRPAPRSPSAIPTRPLMFRSPRRD